MADLKITSRVVKPANSGVSQGQTAKTAPSAFDSIRSQLAGKVAQDVKLPPPVQPTPQQIAAIDNGLQKQLGQTSAPSAAEFFKPQMKNVAAGIDKVSQAVNRIPPQSSSGAIRDRLNAIEQQYQRSGALIQRLKDMDPKSLLNAQVQLYQLSENVELLSKVVDQLRSGAKTVMQTQV